MPAVKEIVRCVFGNKATKEIEKISQSNDTVKRRVDNWNCCLVVEIEYPTLSTRALYFLILSVSTCLCENTFLRLLSTKHKYKKNQT